MMKKHLRFYLFSLLSFFVFVGWGQVTTSYDFASVGAESGLNENSPGISLDSNIGFGSFKNSGTSNPGIFSNQLRLYQNATKGGSIKVYANNGVTITKIIVNASGTTGPAAYTVDSGAQVNMVAGNTYTIDGISATTEVEFFQRDGSSSNRIYIDNFDVTYTSPAGGVFISDQASLTNLDYEVDSGPSIPQSFSLSGTDLDGSDVTVSVPVSSDFEIAETVSGTYSNSITLASFDGTATDIFVRLKSGLTINLYSDDITVSGGGASDITVSLEGEVTPEPINYDNEETFVNYPETSGTYKYGNFAGIAGNTWNYVNARGDINIDAETVTLQNNSAATLNSSISGGISVFEFDYQQAFSTDVNLEVYVNGSLVTTVTSSSEQGVTKNSGQISVNETGTFTIEFKQGSSGGQTAIDNFKWNSFTAIPDFTYESGAWSPSDPVGSSTATDNILIADGSIDVTGTLVANNLEVALGATLNITSSGILDLVGNIINNGDLVFQSDASGSGQLANFSGTVTGNITTERFIPKRSDDARAFRFLASPVGNVNIADAWQQDTHITGAGGASNGFDASGTNNPSMFTFDHSIQDQVTTSAWTPIASTTQGIVAGQPYRLFVRGDRGVSLSDNGANANDVTLSATGTLHTGNHSVTTSNFFGNFTFIGNPYQAVVHLNNLTYGAAVNTNSAYYWDPSLGVAGGFVTIALPSGVPDPSSSDADEFLRPGQAVFMQNDTTGSDFSIEFNEDDKATSGSQTQVFSVGENVPAFVNMRIYKTDKLNNGFTEEDAFGLRFTENGNNAVDALDASKMGNPGINLASVNSNQLFSIENRALPQIGENIPFLLNNLSTASYTFTFNVQNFNTDDELFLKDNYTGELIPIQLGNTEIEFTADANIQESLDILRFELVFGNVTLSNEDFNLVEDMRIHPNPVKDQINISVSNSLSETDLKIEVYDVLGRQVMQTTATFTEDKSYPIDATDLKSGIYFLKLDIRSKNQIAKFIKL
ncbi:T9SS type A sorting domain-containing protein [Psychroflexus salis]|uniref:Secretion system C-terminal sorting domain-containing protein n=1 Tax=Psychroflexus salis TaxID=1526574 RepID=A0A916ZLG3_9FLAO|nr:T9SS type A sorting domain-containing protein [Psychroflexus salis]GGE02672.1 hypothetical protein GCM10010831_00490 [Psychroflexus salis]